MTDQNIPNVTDDDRRLAREWAAFIESRRDNWTDRIRAAARVILNAVPAPPLPTLADMTEEERAACQWMQADVADHNTRYVIANPHDRHGEATLIAPDGQIEWILPEYVTPLPDLPRLEWPGDKNPAPALPDGWRLADHEDHGRGVVTNLTPNRDGRVYFVIPADDPMGYDWIFCTPDELTYLEQGADTSDTVPESTLSVGSVWKNANALTRACSESGRDQIAVIDKNGDVGVWDAELRGWRAYTPGPVFAPYTIIHTGREDDQ